MSSPKQTENRKARRAAASARPPVERMAYGVIETAEALCCGKSHIYDLIAEGKIRTIKVGNRRLVPTEELKRVVAEGA